MTFMVGITDDLFVRRYSSGDDKMALQTKILFRKENKIQKPSGKSLRPSTNKSHRDNPILYHQL